MNHLYILCYVIFIIFIYAYLMAIAFFEGF